METIKLFNYYPFNKLPIDIIYYGILPYTYKPQSKELTEDIKNYYNSKLIITKSYYCYWIIGYEETEPSDKEWLINDLGFFSNKNIDSMYGY